MAQPFVHEPVLIIFADTIFDADMNVITKADADGILWAKEVEDYQRFGVIVHENGIMKRIVEKPSEPISKLANIGAYYIRDYKTLFEGIDYVFENNMQTKGEYYLTDAFQYMVDHGKILRVAEVKGWYDTGTQEILMETNRILLAQQSRSIQLPGVVIIPPVWIEDNVSIANSVIGPNVSIAAGAVIEKSIISESIVNVNAHITNVNLKDSIVGDSAEVRGTARKLSVGSHSSLQL